MTEHETERARLARTYSEMSDEALKELSGDAGSLTEIAKEVLTSEIASRGIEVRNVAVTEPRQHSGPLLMVKRFRDLPEAFVARSILDSADIDSFLADENLVRIDWLYSNLIGGAKLMVRPEDFEEAKALLDESANETNAMKEEEQGNEPQDAGEASE
ncbi:MAG TPA: DUF2007 domain-containing protein [Candidatus Acidoferrum sp.]|nr:DUF2007 domain-containing protein [Candidatus Acidoferrum sp.]